MNRCKSCHAPIDWIVTPKNRRMPVDLPRIRVVRADEGRVVIVTDAGEVVRGIGAESGVPGELVEGRTSHFATCPNAKGHRKR